MSSLVSVIIPVFNIEDYIGRCIESIIQQTYTNIEVIIVDDGSTDESGEICRQYADKDFRVIYIYQENKGLVGARKTGLLNAKGKYIVFADGDDYAEKDYVEKLYGFMINNDVDFVHSNYLVNGRNQKFVKKVHLYEEKDLSLEFRTELLRDYVFEWDAEKEILDCNVYGCIYRKSVICDCYMELPDAQQYGEDLLCLCNLVMRCKSMMLLPYAYYHYTIREGSLDHSENFMKAMANKVSLYGEIEKNLRKYNIFSALSNKYQMFFIQKIFWDFKLISDEKIQMKEEYVCRFMDLLMGKKIVLYGAGAVGQSLYEQLTNFESIEIAVWVDCNFRNIHSLYRPISNPALINTLKYDYIVLAVSEENMAKEITDYLSQMNIDRKKILWQPYSKNIFLSLL